MPKSSTLPDSAITVRTYAELVPFAERFAENKLPLIGVVGAAGIGKTQLFKQVFGPREYLEISGHATPFGLYIDLFKHLNLSVIIDDADTLFQSKQCSPLLKSLCDTVPLKTLRWRSKAVGDEAPPEFQTTSRVAVLCNRWDGNDANMRAVADRGLFIHFQPSVREVHERVRQLGFIKDAEVFNFVEQHLRLIAEPSMRYYRKAVQLKEAGIADWRDVVLRMLNPASDPRDLEVLSQILADLSIFTEAERVSQFQRLTGKSQATYYRYRETLLANEQA